jgi:hypothetical protein
MLIRCRIASGVTETGRRFPVAILFADRAAVLFDRPPGAEEHGLPFVALRRRLAKLRLDDSLDGLGPYCTVSEAVWLDSDALGGG